MSQPVTVEHGGVTVTTNTASEADLRRELETPAPTAETPAVLAPPPPPAEAAPPEVPPKERDEKGRFVKREEERPTLDVNKTPEEVQALIKGAEEPAREDGLPRHDPIARMKKALAQKAEAERRAAALEQEVARLRDARPSPPPSPASAPMALHADAEPQFEAFAQEADPYTAYLQAWTRWDRAQAIAQAKAQWDAEQTVKTRTQQFETRIREGAQQYPNWQEVLTEADTLGLQVSAVMHAAIVDSPRAADLVHDLATHPEVCTQLAEESLQTPVAAAPVMRRLLEMRLEPLAPRAAASNGAGTAARAVTSTAKPPVTPVGSSPVVSDAPPGDEASAAEHARYWNRKLKVPGTK